MLSWAQRRKFVVLAILAGLVLGTGIFLFTYLREPSNNLPPKSQKLTVLWTRFFEVRDGFLDVAALLRNPNNFRAQKIVYSFKIYDKNNILIAIQEGETFASPLERFVIFEPNISVSERVPGKVLLDIKDTVFLEDQSDLSPKIDVLGTERFLSDIFPRILVQIKNREEKSLENVQSTIVIFGEDQNAVAVSRTLIPFLGIGEERSINFTWPKVFNGVSAVEVFFR